jgi:hypothetical protein
MKNHHTTEPLSTAAMRVCKRFWWYEGNIRASEQNDCAALASLRL